MTTELHELNEKINKTKSQVGHFSVKNVNKRDETARKNLHLLRDNQRKVAKLTNEVDTLVLKLEECNASMAAVRDENENLRKDLCESENKLTQLLNERKKKLNAQKMASHWKIKATKQQNVNARVNDPDHIVNEPEVQVDAQDEVAENMITKKGDGTYTDNVHLCIVELASLEVATEKISPAISAVVKHLLGHNLQKSDLPNKTTTQTIVDEGHFLAKTYISEKLENSQHWGINRDGTSRQKKKLLDTSVTLSNGEVISLGFTRVAHETATAINSVTQQHLEELSQVNEAKKKATEHEQQDDEYIARALERLSFAMSDRASNEKRATQLLIEWRDGVLRNCREEETINMVHSFHCMAHVLLGFHQYASKDIKEFEKRLVEQHGSLGRDKLQMFKFWKTVKTVVERVVLMSSDTFGPVGEYLGVRDRWEAHCKAVGIKSIIGNYKDNRFNALFQTAAEVFVHRKEFLKVLKTVDKPNRKLQSVIADLECQIIGTLLQSFGLVYYKITGPFWNMVTSGQIPYLQLYPQIQGLLTYLTKCTEEPETLLLMEGNWMPNDQYGFSQIPHRNMLRDLFDIPENNREILLEACSIICKAMGNTVKKQLIDFLEGGKYANEPSAEELRRTEFAKLTNLGCEHHFGDLDSSQRRRPNSSLHHHSSIQLLKRNRTGWMDWMANMEESDRANIMKTARKEGKVLRDIHISNEKNVLRDIHQEMSTVNAQPKNRKKRKNSTNHDEQDRQRQREDIELDAENIDVANDLERLLPIDVHFKENEYVAIAYQDNWYPGIVLQKLDDKNARVKFMTPCHQKGFYKWPSRDDIQEVNVEFILKKGFEIECQSSGRQWYLACHSEIQNVYEMFSSVCF